MLVLLVQAPSIDAPLSWQGIGVPTEPKLARELYEKAFDAGSSAAAFFLGHRLHNGDEGLGIKPDGARALQLLETASNQVQYSSFRLWIYLRCNGVVAPLR